MSESNEDNLTSENNFTVDDCFAPLERFKRNRLSRSQFGLMVDFMTLNPELVHGTAIRATSKEEWSKKWEELSELLNADWTGAKRKPERWRKAWQDQKNLIKIRAAKYNESGSDDSKLSELQERVLKLMKTERKDFITIRAPKQIKCKKTTGSNKSCKLNKLEEKGLKLTETSDKNILTESPAMAIANHNLENTYNFSSQNVQNVSHQVISPSGYIVFGVKAQNIPMTVQPAYQSTSKIETSNVLIGLEPSNILLPGLQSSSDKFVSVEEKTVFSSSASTNQINKSQNISDIELSLKSVAGSSETQTQVEESEENNTSSLIVKLQPYEVSKSHGNSSTSETGQKCNNQEKTAENVNSSVQNSSSNLRIKRRKLHHQPLFLRRNEITVAKLLQRQNELLEGIAGTLTRIEKSVKERLSLEDQRKNNMLINISENIERLSESLGTVSKSLKTIADK